MNELLKLIDRFQSLKNKTGKTKSSSYHVSLAFDPDSDDVDIQWSCYDIADYPRLYETTSTRAELLQHMSREIELMERAIQSQLS